MADTGLLDHFEANPKEMKKHEVQFQITLNIFDLADKDPEAYAAISRTIIDGCLCAAMIEVTRLHQALSMMLEGEAGGQE